MILKHLIYNDAFSFPNAWRVKTNLNSELRAFQHLGLTQEKIYFYSINR